VGSQLRSVLAAVVLSLMSAAPALEHASAEPQPIRTGELNSVAAVCIPEDDDVAIAGGVLRTLLRSVSSQEPVGRGDVACGPNLVCASTTQYCSVRFGGPVGVPPSYACAELPRDCPSRTCECFRAWIGCKCAEPGSQITVTCTAP
jgi:hypothetical protein